MKLDTSSLSVSSTEIRPELRDRKHFNEEFESSLSDDSNVLHMHE